MPALDTFTLILLVICGSLAFLFLSVCFFARIEGFRYEMQYINGEIRRTEGSERAYWIKRRRRLWLSLIPFVRY